MRSRINQPFYTMGQAPLHPSSSSSSSSLPVRDFTRTREHFLEVENRNARAIATLRKQVPSSEVRKIQLRAFLEWWDIQVKNLSIRDTLRSSFGGVFSWISLSQFLDDWVYSPFAVASDSQVTAMALVFEIYANPRKWLDEAVVSDSSVSPFMGCKSLTNTEVQFVQTCWRCFWTGAGVENVSDNFHLESLFPIAGLFDPRNEVLVCTSAPRTVPFRFQYTDKPQAVEVKSCFREPCALFASVDQCYKWMGWYPLAAGKQWIVDAQSGETHSTSVSSDGKLLCPRSSVRRHIASVWMYLMHKYPSLRRQLEGFLSWDVALAWLQLPVTLRELFMDLYSQRLMGDLNPFCYSQSRVEMAERLVKSPPEPMTFDALEELKLPPSSSSAQYYVLGHTSVLKYSVLHKNLQLQVYSDSPGARKPPLLDVLNRYYTSTVEAKRDKDSAVSDEEQ